MKSLVAIACSVIVLTAATPHLAVEAQTTMSYAVSFPTWATARVDGPFLHVVANPSRRELIATVSNPDARRQRLVSVDTETYEVTEGPVLEYEVAGLVPSSDGQWIHVLRQGQSSDFYGLLVDRFAAADLSFDQTIELGTGGFEGAEASAVVAVPGDGSLLLAQSFSELALYRDGVRLPDVVSAGSFPDLAVSDQTLAFVRDSFQIRRLDLGPTGISEGLVVPTDRRTGTFEVFGNDLRSGSNLFTLPDLDVVTPAEPWQEFGDHDAASGLVIVDTSNFRSTSGAAGTVGRYEFYDAVTGELAQPEAGLPPQILELSASGRDLLVTDRLLSLGSYGEFQALQPARVFDTRNGEGRDGNVERLAPQSTTRVKIHGLGGVPEDGVESVVLNVTAVDARGSASGSGFLGVSPAGFGRPEVSNVNFATGAVTGNMVTVSTAADGEIDVHNGPGTVHVTIDVLGFFGSALADDGARYFSHQELQARTLGTRGARILDARDADERLGPSGATVISLPRMPSSRGETYGTLRGVVLNVVAVQPTRRSYLQIFGEGGQQPSASSMNFEPGVNTARLVTSNVGPNGRVVIRNELGSVGVVVDIVGYYVDDERGQKGRFVGTVPERLIDTRLDSPFAGDGRMSPMSALRLGGFLPDITLAANLTTVGSTSRGFATINSSLGDFSQQFLTTSSINYEPGRNVANHALVPTGIGEFGVYHDAGSSHVLVDLFGFYTARDDF